MLKMTTTLYFLTLGGLAFAQPPQLDNAIADKLCSACHYYTNKPASEQWPVLIGKNRHYLQTQLLAFKTGDRFSPIMGPIARNLSDTDIINLADFYAQLSAIQSP